MRQVIFTPDASRDIQEIWEYIVRDSIDAADKVVTALDTAIRMLAELPGIGHARTDVDDPRIRFWRVYSYLVAFRHTDAELVIVRVVHGARDIRLLLDK